MKIISLEKKISDLFIYYLCFVLLALIMLFPAGINISFALIICFFLFWSWRFKRNHINSINKLTINLLSIATGSGILCFSTFMMYKHYTGNVYYYYMSDKIAIITAILSIPFFLPVCDFEKTVAPHKRFVKELILMLASFIILVIYCGILWTNGFITPFTAN